MDTMVFLQTVALIEIYEQSETGTHTPAVREIGEVTSKRWVWEKEESQPVSYWT